MKTIILFMILSLSIFAQDKSMEISGNMIELGMTMDQVWENLKANLNVVEDTDGNFYISDKYNNPVAIIMFRNEKVIKILKDWGTSYKNNAGQVFKILWKIFKQYDKDLDAVKIIPLETYTPKGDKINLQFYITENRYIDIAIQHTCTIYEVVEDLEN